MKQSSLTVGLLASVLSLSVLFSAPAQAKPFSQFIEFSGALSDTGNYASTHGESPAPFYKNRTTNGPVAGELLAARMGFQVKSSNHLVGPAVGTNFAVRDALAGADGPDDLPQQLKAYLEPRGGKADPDAFYFVFNGGNDVILAATAPTPAASDKIINDAVDGLEHGLRTLVKAGAKTIMAPNFIDISVVPALRNTPLAGHARDVSQAYNQKFEAMLARLEGELNIHFIHWDFDAFLKGMIAHGSEFGFSNTLDSCEALKAKGQCDPDHFLYLTETFPTAKVHEFMAQAMAVEVAKRGAN
ncbi:SGNH/GDSL hydrolase family protein [Collimonas pratensis]|uniref:GDSL-like Lipase/Acylhydrolase family protein n=1 Tax=Collimonas pratensis TaxID=279113 RepID=A0A127QC35_9BURK|nr:SGNH/GDSL hydrolase family protein [Collimonas pratensis]AMP07571.1 GDSL-like Lipase/Acylhydrolase family protein [Collimonas pratensis]